MPFPAPSAVRRGPSLICSQWRWGEHRFPHLVCSDIRGRGRSWLGRVEGLAQAPRGHHRCPAGEHVAFLTPLSCGVHYASGEGALWPLDGAERSDSTSWLFWLPAAGRWTVVPSENCVDVGAPSVVSSSAMRCGLIPAQWG